MRAQGTAPAALRWERLKNRYDSHRKSVDDVSNLLASLNVTYRVISRDEMHRGNLLGRDLVIAVGGDGTVLNSASFLDDSIPILGVNSDPTKPEEKGVTKVVDERRSKGALCAATTDNIREILPQIILGEISPYPRTRLHCIVRSTYTETKMPPALNDILISHPSPASVSRFRMSLTDQKENEVSILRYISLYLYPPLYYTTIKLCIDLQLQCVVLWSMDIYCNRIKCCHLMRWWKSDGLPLSKV